MNQDNIEIQIKQLENKLEGYKFQKEFSFSK